MSAGFINCKKLRRIFVSTIDDPPQHGRRNEHAEWMRRTRQETNACTAWLAGTGHEVDGLLGNQPWAEALMDLHNNAVGRNAGSNNSPVDPSKLWMLPNNGSSYNPYRGVW